jgi:tripartite-type tricarboxylate transporter receptor subunit TctC
MVGRALCERLAKVLGQSVVVDNIGGGGGVIASQNTARAAADGYTLMQGYVATHGTAPATRKLPYDAEKDFTPIPMCCASTPACRHKTSKLLLSTSNKTQAVFLTALQALAR